jgi:hypothetical protein
MHFGPWPSRRDVSIDEGVGDSHSCTSRGDDPFNSKFVNSRRPRIRAVNLKAARSSARCAAHSSIRGTG